jgi:hypothetical protein
MQKAVKTDRTRFHTVILFDAQQIIEVLRRSDE